MKTFATQLLLILVLLACAPGAETSQADESKSMPDTKTTPSEESFATVSIDEIVKLLDAGEAPVLYDCRTAKEYDEGHVPTAINLSHDLLPKRIDELEPYKDQKIVVYCRSGRRARLAYKQLEAAGFQKLALMPGDMIEWKKRELPLEKTPPPTSEQSGD